MIFEHEEFSDDFDSPIQSLAGGIEVQEGQSDENKKHDNQKVDQRHHHLVRDFWRLIL